MKLKRISSKNCITYINVDEIYGFSIVQTIDDENVRIKKYRTEFYTMDGKIHESDKFDTQIEAFKFANDILNTKNYSDDILNEEDGNFDLPPTLPYPSKVIS